MPKTLPSRHADVVPIGLAATGAAPELVLTLASYQPGTASERLAPVNPVKLFSTGSATAVAGCVVVAETSFVVVAVLKYTS